MEMTLQERLNKLLDAYSHNYDIYRDVTVEGGSFPAAAFYHLRDENYLISKQHVLSAVPRSSFPNRRDFLMCGPIRSICFLM